MKKRHRKNPHAVALGRLGGLVRSEAKKRASKLNGRKGGLVKAARRLLLPDATLDGQDPGAARKGERGDILDPRTLRKMRYRVWRPRHPLRQGKSRVDSLTRCRASSEASGGESTNIDGGQERVSFFPDPECVSG